MEYKRSIDGLESHGVMWWPEHLNKKNAEVSVVPKMQSTHDDFLSILSLCKDGPFQVFGLIESSNFPANLFVKHLCVLSDYGGEPLQRLGRSFGDIFEEDEEGNHKMTFFWGGDEYEYEFKALPVRGLSNSKLKTDGDKVLTPVPVDDLFRDIIVILLHGSTSTASNEAALASCEVGAMLGDKERLENYVKQRYISVSRITGGATANTLGQLAQTEIVDSLKAKLGDEYQVERNGYIPLEGYDSAHGMPFDVVVKKGDKTAGIEVSFQVTTNSTIERKAGQSPSRQQLMHDNGQCIAYVIDGAGNFQRRSAVQVICENSDCTVAYSESEFQVLADWIGEVL